MFELMPESSLLRGRDKILNSLCSIKHPTRGEIESLNFEAGYELYTELLFSLILNPKDLADTLWFDNQVWYEDIENDWIFFIQRAFTETQTIEVSLDLENMKYDNIEAVCVSGNIKTALNYFLQISGDFIFLEKEFDNTQDKQVMLVNVGSDNVVTEDNFKLTEYYYNILVNFLKEINWVKIEYDFVKGGNKQSKIWILQKMYKKRHKKQNQSITLGSITSSLIAKETNNSDIWNYPIYLIYDQYYRLVKIDEYKNTMSALYAGGIDTKQNPVNWEKINWSSVLNFN